jgi:hypothetical protein
MKDLLDKLKNLIYIFEAEKKSEFLICAMILPGESYDKWDFILSARWLNSSELESYKLISSKLQTSLTEAELLQIARIVILDPDDQVVKFLQTLITVTNGGYKELRAEDLTDKFKFIIKRGYLLRSIPESRKQ